MLMATHLIGFGAGSSSGPVTVSLTDSKVSGSSLTTYTFAGCAIGTAAADRIILVGVCGQDGSAAGVASMTIGGNAATEIIEANSSVGGNVVNVALYYLLVPSGTTADVAVTFGGGQSAAAAGVWAIYSSTGTPTNSNSSTAGSGDNTDTIDCPANGVVVGYSGLTQTGADPTSAVWSAITESLDQTVGSGERLVQTGAHDQFAAVQTGLSVTMTPTDAGASVLLLASFGPVA